MTENDQNSTPKGPFHRRADHAGNQIRPPKYPPGKANHPTQKPADPWVNLRIPTGQFISIEVSKPNRNIFLVFAARRCLAFSVFIVPVSLRSSPGRNRTKWSSIATGVSGRTQSAVSWWVILGRKGPKASAPFEGEHNMPALKSVSKPVGEESLAVPVAREVTKGSRGKEAPGNSRAAARLLVRGKQEAPLRRRRAGGIGAVTIIGPDDRTRIIETEMTPWRMICALKMSAPGGSFIGTGWFAGPRTIITAGHCVFGRGQMGGWADEIMVVPGEDGSERPFGEIRATRFSASENWVRDQDPDFDYGAIHLDEPLGQQTGWFAVGALPDQSLINALVNISGYPGDLAMGDEQWFHANRVLRTTGNRIFYDVDTFGGQSGSPVWMYETADAKAEPIVVGIHAYGVGGTPASFGITANSAPRINQPVLERISEWVAADNGGN
jgi:V8-like Glu-specific endopeptidase